VTIKVLSILGFLISSAAMATIQDAVAVIPSRLPWVERKKIEQALLDGLASNTPDGRISVEQVMSMMEAMGPLTGDEQSTLLAAWKRPAPMAEEWKGENKERKEVRPASSSSSSSSSAPVPAPAPGWAASGLDAPGKRGEFDRRFYGEEAKAMDLILRPEVVDQTFVENLFLDGQVLICDLGNAQGEGFGAHTQTMFRVWKELLTTFQKFPSIIRAFPSWESALKNELTAALPEEKARPLPSPWRVRRVDPGAGSEHAIGHTVVWSPTFQMVIIGRISADRFFEERFLWMNDSAGRKLTLERVQELLGRCLYSGNTKYGTWVSYRPLPPEMSSEAVAPGGPVIEPTLNPEA
jgi:hypothetical protein